ncbi:MAG: hypothetical protein AB7F78_10790 [Hyphomicrobiaceae bacterium]
MLAHFIRRAASDCVRGHARAAIASSRPTSLVADRHLDAAASWLVRSIEACGGVASSKGYRFMKGWMPPYPETTGYIIPTLLALDRSRGSDKLEATALEMGRWLTGVQQPGGGFAGYELGLQSRPDVFDTGMILLGFNALIHKGEREAFLEPARKAAEFLAQSMDESGCFVRNMSHDMVHAYNVRSAWGLMAFGQLAGDRQLINRAAACADWTIGQQNAHGFYLQNSFKPGGNANTHGTAYVMRGLLQCHMLSGDARYLASVKRAAAEVCRLYAREGWIAAELGPEWQYLSSHICLTGYAQLAIVLYRLFVMEGDAEHRRVADLLLEDVARHQTLDDAQPWHGGIAGSFPIWGRYAPLQYPNWATKFFVDAVLAQRHAHAGAGAWPEIELYAG